LDLSENPFEGPAQLMAHRLLRNNGFAPPWIEEGREIDAAIVQSEVLGGDCAEIAPTRYPYSITIVIGVLYSISRLVWKRNQT
jgi:hypothetical protein